MATVVVDRVVNDAPTAPAADTTGPRHSRQHVPVPVIRTDAAAVRRISENQKREHRARPRSGSVASSSSSIASSPSSFSESSVGTTPTKTKNNAASKTRRSSGSSAGHALKKKAERKFRHRYMVLQQTYEQRLQALAAQVRHVVAELKIDSTIPYLQEDPLTSEYAHARVMEIIQESFFGEREKYIKMVSDQIAWQTDDLRDAQERIKGAQRNEKATQKKWKHAQKELSDVRRELDARMQLLREQQVHSAEQLAVIQKMNDERDQYRREVEQLTHKDHSFETLQREYEALQVKLQDEREQERLAHEDSARQIMSLQQERDNLVSEKKTLEQELSNLRHQLSTSETKNSELTASLEKVQSQEFPTKLLKLEHSLAHQRHVSATLEKENEQLKSKYEEFGTQVEAYMDEQKQDREVRARKAEQEIQELKIELESVRHEGQSAIKVKQSELARIMDQLKFRQEALTRAEQKIAALEQRLHAMDVASADEHKRSTKMQHDGEKEVAKWRLLLEREQEKAKTATSMLAQIKQSYEEKLAALQDTLDHQQQQSVKERELEARTRWENDFLVQQEARIEALKNKYDAALETQQNELVQARQIAVNAAKSAAEKIEEAKMHQKKQREEQEDIHLRHEQAREMERRRTEAEKTREAAYRRQMRELDERDRRLRDREEKLVEKERREEKRRVASLAAEKATQQARATEKTSECAAPRVFVLNVNGSDDQSEEDHGDTVVDAPISVVNKRRSDRKLNRSQSRSSADSSEVSLHANCIPLAQHQAELQAREALIALESEKRLQQQCQEFQERKEKEMRNAMVNVRKGIQKLEGSLQSEKDDRKRYEEELFQERQAFVALKATFEEEKEVKRTLVQRLEEANDNIGRLRDVVKAASEKADGANDQANVALLEKSVAIQSANDAKQEMETAHSRIQMLEQEHTNLQSQLRERREEYEGTRAQLDEMEAKLMQREQDFERERIAMDETRTKEVEQVKSLLTARITELEAQTNEHVGHNEQLKVRSDDATEMIEQLVADKKHVESNLVILKAELEKQRKAFNDLARMHKNLTATMNTKVENEKSIQQRLQQQVERLNQSRELLQNSKMQGLEDCMQRVKLMKSECRSLRKSVRVEVKAASKHLYNEIRGNGDNLQLVVQRAVECERQRMELKVQTATDEWRQRVQIKEREINELLANNKVDDQARLDQLMDRLDAKSEEVYALERQLHDGENIINELKHANASLKRDLDTLVHEHSQVVDQLSSSQISTKRASEATQKWQDSVANVSTAARALKDFTLQLLGDHNIDLSEMDILCRTEDTKATVTDVVDNWELAPLLRDLGRARQAINDRVRTLTSQTTNNVLQPLKAELAAAKDALFPFAKEDPSEGGSLMKHLPWYIVVVRSIKQSTSQLRKEIKQARLAMHTKDARLVEIKSDLDKLEQTHKVLVFEKDTMKHELMLQIETLQKKREQDMQHQREDYDNKLDQLQRRHAKEQVKIKEEQQLVLEQLTDALETEKKAHGKLKHDAMKMRVEIEKLQGDLEDRPKKLEEEIGDLREAVSKWKRKAKRATKSAAGSLTPGTPGARPSLVFTSSFQDSTGDDDPLNDSSRSLFPSTPRRPSSAMADLSNLMEQSLHDLRKDNESWQQSQSSPLLHTPSPRRAMRLQFPHPSPVPLRMRRLAHPAPMPLRIPVHPSPARRRTAVTTPRIPPPIPHTPAVDAATPTPSSH